MLDKQVVELVNLKVISNIEQEYKGIGILEIIEITTALITLFKECKDLRKDAELDSSKILETMRNPTFFNKVRLYLCLRRQCRKNGTKPYLNAIVKAVLEAGQTATPEDAQVICDAISRV